MEAVVRAKMGGARENQLPSRVIDSLAERIATEKGLKK